MGGTVIANPLKQYSSRPQTTGMTTGDGQWTDWVTSALNTLVGQHNATTQQGINGLIVNTVNPQTNQITSAGSRMQSIATGIIAVPGATSITFFWDGTNGSELLKIYRDDGTVAGPFSGSFTIQGLAAATKYFFYPYFDESNQVVNWAFVSGVSVGTPGVAFLAQNIPAAQQQFLRTRVPLSLNFATVGVTTGGGTTHGGTGGGGGSGGGGRYQS